MRQFAGVDNESHLFRPGLMVPPMVCTSVALDPHNAVLFHRRDPRIASVLRQLLEGAATGRVILVGQFIAFDLVMWANEFPELLPLVFAAYDRDGVTDTKLRQKLLDIAAGALVKEEKAYTLQKIAERWQYPHPLDKDTWRLRYGEFENVPCEAWPAGAVEYSLHDAKAPVWVAQCQEQYAEQYLADEFRQARADFALHTVAAYGMVTDPIMCAKYRREVETVVDSLTQRLKDAGLVYKDRAGEYHKKAKLAQKYAEIAWNKLCDVMGMDLPTEARTATGYSLSEDALKLLGDDLLSAYQEFGSKSNRINRVEELEAGIRHPIHTSFDTLKITGRTGSYKPPMQNRPKNMGDRECIVPRPGNVFLNADVDGLELRGACQSMIYAGISPRMAHVLNGRELNDPHSYIAAEVLGISLEDAHRRKNDPADLIYDEARQTGKVANFGLLGGLGATRFIKQARAQYKVTLNMAQAKKLIDTWHRTWPEMRQYFNWINSLCSGGGGRATVTHFVSDRVRGNAPYTEACNLFFQGLGADATKDATYALVKECLIGTGPLAGCRVVHFIHDEWLIEAPEDSRLAERMAYMEHIIATTMNRWLPDVPVRAKPKAVRRWSKAAKSVKDAAGNPVPWEWPDAITEYRRLGLRMPHEYR